MLRPMLASLADAPLQDPALVYEPKYDGIRAIAEIGKMETRGRAPARGTAPPPLVRLWSRLGNEKTDQFPEIVGALFDWARELDEPVVLDGEIVALTASGAGMIVLPLLIARIGAVFGQHQRRCPADAGATAGDDGDLPCHREPIAHSLDSYSSRLPYDCTAVRGRGERVSVLDIDSRLE